MFYSYFVRALPIALFSLQSQAQAEKVVTPWYIYLVLLAFLAFDFWLIFSRKAKHTARHPKWKMEEAAALEAIDLPKQEDLTLIEGIGPVINRILHEAGINTFNELAGMPPEAIKIIVVAGGVNLVDTSTWPRQAELAAEGNFDELKVYQDSIN